jgi:hypothetical protein
MAARHVEVRVTAVAMAVVRKIGRSATRGVGWRQDAARGEGGSRGHVRTIADGREAVSVCTVESALLSSSE